MLRRWPLTRHILIMTRPCGWLRARDVLAGEDAVKAPGRNICRGWIPRRMRSLRLIGRGLVLQCDGAHGGGFVGLIFRRPPFVKVPDVERGWKGVGGVRE